MPELKNTSAKILFILGRQSNLGLAELESVYPDDLVASFNSKVAISDSKVDHLQINRLGGVIKIAEVLDKTGTKNWKEIENYVKNNTIEEILNLPDGKIDFGISTYEVSVSPREITNFCLSIKKIIKSRGRSIRIIPNQNNELSSAQIIHNHMSSGSGFELIIAAGKESVLFAKTTGVQDIYDYAARDQQRPKRDAKVGMLPPKLAQIMINLANPKLGSRVLDPFCGTGVILQEALLMGYETLGSDIEARMVEYTNTNLKWLEESFGKLPSWGVEVGDATTKKWSIQIDSVVCETYLGKPLFKILPDKELITQALEVNNLIEKFLKNLQPQIKSGTRLCLAVPSWKIRSGFFSLELLDHLEKIGYNHMSFKTVDDNDLIYHRPDQLVARQLLVLIRK